MGGGHETWKLDPKMSRVATTGAGYRGHSPTAGQHAAHYSGANNTGIPVRY